MGRWTLDPLQLAPLAIVATAYALRARTLARRGQPVPRWRAAVFATGVALVLVAVASPVAALGEQELFTFHMVQHVLLGDLAPLALLAGLTGPLLRPVLALPVVERLRVLTHPFVALPLWTLNLVVWHLPPLYEAAVRNDLVHALEHVSFFTAGALMWATVLETLPQPEWFSTGWKLGYVVAVRAAETIVGNVFVWAGEPLYDVYVHADPLWGIGALRDQGIAGAVMMIEGSLVTLAALAWLFLRMAQEGEVRQRLLERGHDPRAVKRAVRYRRWQELEGGR